MSHRNRLVLIYFVALLPSSRLQAIVITPTRDIHDDAQVINHVQDDPRVGGWRRETEWFRRRLLRWKARDYRMLFGAPIEAHNVDDALMVGEARLLGFSVHNDGAWRATEWRWYDTPGELVRLEADSNGDGVPDVQGTSELFDHPPDLPLGVDRSWAVHPELVPETLRFPGQAERRVSLRRIPE